MINSHRRAQNKIRSNNSGKQIHSYQNIKIKIVQCQFIDFSFIFYDAINAIIFCLIKIAQMSLERLKVINIHCLFLNSCECILI